MASTESIIDALNSKVSFSIKKLGLLTIRGRIYDFQGNIIFDENDLESASIKASVSPPTIKTGNFKRDEHLKSNDFFYVTDFPKISFQSTTFQKEKNRFLVQGKLTLLNKTHEVSIPFVYEKETINCDFSLNRLDYNLGSKFTTFIIGKTVQISINIKTTSI
jgi:polyisoprenoid-binding protein YceI